MTPIYHITHVHNLPGIVREGGLWCDRICDERKLPAVEVAHQHIKDRRAARAVNGAAGGTLADYVPFYFAPRSPMLYVINRGNVQGYDGGQRPIVHLVSSCEQVQEAGLPFAFTDGHAVIDISQFYTELQDLDKIDWPLMESPYWFDTQKDPDRKRRRQAEFLVYQFFPLSLIDTIGVMNAAVAEEATASLVGLAQKPSVEILPAWYY